MEEIEVKWAHAIRIWWAWFWRTMALAIPLSLITGFVIGVMMTVTGTPIEGKEVYLQLMGAAIWFYFSIEVMKKVLTMSFGSFRIALLKTTSAADRVDL